MELPTPTDPVFSHSVSPLYLLAVLVSAKKSGDRILARVTHRRLVSLGVDVRFVDDQPTADCKAQEIRQAKPKRKGPTHA